MDETLMEIREFTGLGYQPVVDYLSWRVAVLNYIDEIHPENISFMERHNLTDEVFVLIQGQAILYIGEGKGLVEKIIPHTLVKGKIYNVKEGAWHTIVLSQDGSVLIVENQNTSKDNSDYFSLDVEHRQLISKVARQEITF